MKKHHFIIILIINSLIIFYPHLENLPVMLDDHIILNAIRKVGGLEDYINRWRFGHVLDLQPVRDISYFIDIGLNKLFGIESFFVLQNIIILIWTTFLISVLLGRYVSNNFAIILSLLFFNHPNIFHIYIEPTSRKHILSLLFFLLSYFYFLKIDLKDHSRPTTKSCLFFTLSILSAPISLNLSLFYLSEVKLFNKKTVKKILPFFVISFVLGVANLYYYKVIYFDFMGYERTQQLLPAPEFFSAIGIIFRQIFFPFIFAFYYISSTIPTLIFTVLSPFIIWLPLRNKSKTRHFIFIYLIIIFTLYGLGTSVFYLNTYSLFVSFSFLFLYAPILEKRKYSTIILSAIFFLTTIYFSYSREEEKFDYLSRTVKQEPNCRIVQYLILEEAKTGNSKKINEYGRHWLNHHCRIISSSAPYLTLLVATYLIIHNKELNIQEKIVLLKKRLSSQNDLILLSSILYFKAGEINKIEQLFNDFNFDEVPSVFLSETSHILEDSRKLCTESKLSFCDKWEIYLSEIKDIQKKFGIKHLK